MFKHIVNILILSMVLLFVQFGEASAEVSVLAAASLTNALTDIARAFEKETRIKVKTSFAASSALAKQIEQGAPADVFISADTQWMDYLAGKGRIDSGSRRDLLGNTLVLIAPKGKGFPVRMTPDFDFAAAFSGKLCTGVVESVPVGIYAKEALTQLGWWERIKTRLVGTEDVRAALNLVERGECDAGVVYETDAKQSGKVEVVAEFPAGTHAPIVYPAALVTSSADARTLFDFLQNQQAVEIFEKYGFERLPRKR